MALRTTYSTFPPTNSNKNRIGVRLLFIVSIYCVVDGVGCIKLSLAILFNINTISVKSLLLLCASLFLSFSSSYLFFLLLISSMVHGCKPIFGLLPKRFPPITVTITGSGTNQIFICTILRLCRIQN